MFEAILMAKFTTIIFVCTMSFLMGVMVGVIVGRINEFDEPHEEEQKDN